MSVEGAIPRDGHLGAIVYGQSAVNNIRVEGDANLFATFHQMDPGWAVGEFNTADFRTAKELPDYGMGYRALREMFNYGARFASPMAWNGSNGVNAGQPGYVSFTAWRNTPLEDAMRDFAIAHAFVPIGTRLWTFGSAQYADPDGWSALAGAKLDAGPGYIDVTPRDGEAVLVSPQPLALGRNETDLLVLGLDAAAVAAIEVEARTATGAWVALTSRRKVAELAVDERRAFGSPGLAENTPGHRPDSHRAAISRRRGCGTHPPHRVVSVPPAVHRGAQPRTGDATNRAAAALGEFRNVTEPRDERVAAGGQNGPGAATLASRCSFSSGARSLVQHTTMYWCVVWRRTQGLARFARMIRSPGDQGLRSRTAASCANSLRRSADSPASVSSMIDQAHPGIASGVRPVPSLRWTVTWSRSPVAETFSA